MPRLKTLSGNVYEIHSPDLISYPDNKEMSEDAKIIKQILSTFKFID